MSTIGRRIRRRRLSKSKRRRLVAQLCALPYRERPAALAKFPPHVAGELISDVLELGPEESRAALARLLGEQS